MENKRKIAFYTLGCKLNFSETSSISNYLSENIYDKVDFKDFADIYVINSCTVTEAAEKKCITAIKQVRKRNPQAKVAVIGCFSQLKADEIKAKENVDIILGSSNKFELSDILNNLESKNESISEVAHEHTFTPTFSANDRTRSFFKIQDGCDYFCTYCAIPYARGRSRSNSIEKTIAVAKEIAAKGMKEVILTGVNIGDFGKRNGEDFLSLIKQLEKVDGIERYRISSIEPELLTDDIIKFVAESEKFMPHFHIPIQAGSDKILKLMKRKYNTQLFENRLDTIIKYIPDCFIACDIITGFPDETDEDFKNSIDFVASLPLAYLHVFPYSVREGTMAAKMPNQIEIIEKRKRVLALNQLSEAKKIDFYKNHKGKEYHVLFESDFDNGFISGFTENYIRVRTNKTDLVNKIQKVKLTNLTDNIVFDCEII